MYLNQQLTGSDVTSSTKYKASGSKGLSLLPTKGSGLRSQPWHSLFHAMHEHQETLRQQLLSVPTSDPHSAWLHETADCISHIDISDFNTKLLEADSNYSDPELAGEPFPEPYQPPSTDWLCRA